MEMNVEISGGAKALDEGHRAGVGLGAGQSGLFDHKGRKGAVNDLPHWREQLRLGGKQMPQWDGKRDDPLAHRDLGNDMIDEVGRRFRHTAGPTSRAKPSPFTGKGHQLLMGALPAPQPQKSMREDPAFQKCLELVCDKLRQAGPGFLFDVGQEGVEVILDHLVQGGLFGTPAFIGGWRTRGCLTGCCPRW